MPRMGSTETFNRGITGRRCVFAALLALALAGCGGGSTPVTAPAAAVPTTLTTSSGGTAGTVAQSSVTVRAAGALRPRTVFSQTQR